MKLLSRQNLLILQLLAAVTAVILTILALASDLSPSATIPIVSSLVGLVLLLTVVRALVGHS